ncbi:MAG: ABC transporter ATP-binding protein [Thermoleophilia bacterium]|nr:ABC transporter ATP-binding protein [Thermoleophilia bacterium]
MTILKITDVGARYGAIEVLHGISLEVREGEIVSLIGPNGAGKSTLMKTLIGAHSASAGTIEFLGEDITRLATKRRVRRGLALVPEGRQIFPTLTIANNLMLGAYPLGRRFDKQSGQLLEEIYELFPILKVRRRDTAGSLSGGQQQMLAIARALMANPKLILIDELSQGLSPLLVTEIYERLLKIVAERSLAACIVEQEVNLALRIASRAYVLASGRIVLSGAGKDLLDDPQVKSLYLRGRPSADRPASSQAPI